MAKEYYNRRGYHCTDCSNSDNSSSSGNVGETLSQRTYLFSRQNNLPIARTDKVSASGEDTSSLLLMGVHGLCIGQCNSETMSTHGFWWTNQSLQNKRLSRRMSNNSNKKIKNRGSDSSSSSNNNGTTKKSQRLQRAVYGSGVVFYLDRSASIRGIMIWGLPFTSKPSTKSKTEEGKVEDKQQNDGLNQELVDRIKLIIRSNGRIMKDDHKEKIEEMNLDPTLLSQSHFSEESKLLASLALKVSSNRDILSNLKHSRPLHRFVPSKPINVTAYGVLKRNKAIGNGGVGDDIFQRSNERGSDEKARHPSLVHYFSYDWSSSRPQMIDDMSSEDFDDENYDEDLETSNNISSRPPKEEPLWLRKNEEMKTTSLSEKMSDLFAYNLKRGQFYDGNDAVKQAPTPEFVVNAREELDKWVTSEDNESNESD